MLETIADSVILPIIIGIIFSFILRKSFFKDFPTLNLYLFTLLQLFLINKFYLSKTVMFLPFVCLIFFVSIIFKISSTYKKFFSIFAIGFWLVVWGLFKYGQSIEKFLSFLSLNKIGQSFAVIGNYLSVHWSMSSMVGLSFITLKLLHLYFDIKNGRILTLQFPKLFSWLVFFPTLMAGPIQRYQDWDQQILEKKISLEDVNKGIVEIISGLFQKIVIADNIFHLALPSFPFDVSENITFVKLAFATVVYTVYLYFDFAGYSQIAIGISRFWGIQIPQNFNNPLLRRNIQDFWNSWHITFIHFLRDYFYTPLAITLSRKKIFKTKIKGVELTLAIFITFFIAGIWHELSLGYLLWGILNGIGLGVFLLIKNNAPKNKGDFRKWWESSKVGYFCAWVINFSFINLTFFVIPLNVNKIEIILKKISGS